MSDIAQILATDPLKLTRNDIEETIAAFRKARASFNHGNIKAGSTKPLTEKQKAIADLAEKLIPGGLDL